MAPAAGPPLPELPAAAEGCDVACGIRASASFLPGSGSAHRLKAATRPKRAATACAPSAQSTPPRDTRGTVHMDSSRVFRCAESPFLPHLLHPYESTPN